MTDNVTKIWGVSLSILAFSLTASTVSAQTCGSQPTCKELGYTSSIACPNGLKCPFDMSKMYCPSDEPCKVGSILYSDKTCSTTLDKSKTPIAVVFDEKKRLATALKPVDRAWGEYGTNVPILKSCTEFDVSTCDTDGKVNTAIIIAFGKEKNLSFPAAEYCYNYTTAGTEVGDWYLPSMAEAMSLREVSDTVMPKISSAGGNGIYENSWTSNELTDFQAQKVNVSKTSSSNTITYSNKDKKAYFRPVLAF